MQTTSATQDVQPSADNRRALSIALWLALSTCWIVSTFSVIQELCLASACRDTASFVIFGFNLGWFGIGYFSLILVLLWLRTSQNRLDWALTALVFAGIGAELRLLWIQKYIIGGWCPLCVTICCALFISALILVTEKLRCMVSGRCSVKGLLGWLAFVATMIATGLPIALMGVKALV